MKVRKKYQNGGVLSQIADRMRERRAQRRLGRTNVEQLEMTDEEAQQIEDQIADATGGSARSAVGFFDPPSRTIAVDFDDRGDANKPSDPNEILTHELIHSTQYGPLRQLAHALDFETAGRIQDPIIRKSFKDLRKTIRRRDMGDNLSELGNYMAGDRGQRAEYEAIMKTGISSALSKGVDLSGGFDSIARNLQQNSGTTNIRMLADFMNNDWDQNQKEIIMRAINSSKDFVPYNI